MKPIKNKAKKLPKLKGVPGRITKKYKNLKKIQPLPARDTTLDGYCECIPWIQLEMNMDPRKLNKFIKWMRGQTLPIGGVYSGDLYRFLKGWDVID